MPLKPKKKAAVRPRQLSLDERLDRLVKQTEAAARRAESDRDRMARLEKTVDKEREASVRKVEADRDRAVEMTKQVEADRDRVARLEKTVDKEREASVRKVEADRDRLARLEEKVVVDHKNNQGHRTRLSRALEDAFAASLPRAMKARGIVIKPEDVRVRVRKRKDGMEQEYDFIAPNGELVLAGEVKTHLTLGDVEKLTGRLVRFRLMFPEYAGLPVHGVVAGGEIDENASRLACDSGFVILRLEGAEVHPVTAGADYRLKAY